MLRNYMLLIYLFNAIKCLLRWLSHCIIVITPSVFSSLKFLSHSSSNTQSDSRWSPSIVAKGPEIPSILLEESFSLQKKCIDTVTVDISIELLGWHILRRRKSVHKEISVHSLGAIVPNTPCVSLWSYKRLAHKLDVVLCFQKLGPRLKYYPMLQ